MVIPLAVFDFDLAAAPVAADPLPARFRRARVLARWDGVPVGVVEVSVREGRICPRDVVLALQSQHPHALLREAARRALLRTGVERGVVLDAVWHFREPAAPATPSISVVVCTRDRTADLAVCLASIDRLDPAPHEVVVVDNAPSGGHTALLVREKYPHFKYVREPRPGLDHARNRGIAESSGEIIAFTDDDVSVDAAWAGALAHAFACEPRLGLISGLVEPLEQETNAQILFERYGGFGRGCRRMYLQSSRDRPLPWTLVGAGQLGAGANMAVRREVFARIGGFDPALDVGTPTLGGGDHDLFFRVLRAGFLCVYEPAALVRHRHRRTFEELRRLLYCYGHATRCFLDREALNFPSDRSAISRLRRWWWKHWAWQRWWRAAFRPPWVPASLVLAEIRGYWHARGAYRRARAQIVRDESMRPDTAAIPAPPPPELNDGVGIVVIDVAHALSELAVAARFTHVEIVVQCAGRPLGTVRVATFGQPLSARRLADEISHALWHKLLDPAAVDSSFPFVQFMGGFEQRAAPTPPSTPAHAPEVTVVVTTCNRPDALRRCLLSLHRLAAPRSLQIVVVDNRPSVGNTGAVVREFPGTELVIENRRGSSYARNTGIAAARGEIVAMVDDDMHVSDGWLDALLAPFARADVMAVTGNTMPARLETPAERLLELYGGFSRGFVSCDFDPSWFHRRRWRAVPTWQIGGSGNAAFRRRVFSEIALFDVTLGAGVPTGVGEDTKLFYDILHAGHTIVYEPAALAWHHHRVTMPELRQQLYAYSKGHVAYHLRTWADYGDNRALVRIFAELPQAFFKRACDRWRGSSAYPWKMLLLEFAGTLAGPWSLFCAHRSARRLQSQIKPGPSHPHRSRRLSTPARPALEGRT